MTTRTGDTTDGVFSNAGGICDLSLNSAPRYVIWDAGGFDTINLELANGHVELDLRPGAFSSFGGGTNNIAIAHDRFATNPWYARIEAARGGNGRDTLRGNDGDNHLHGGADNDRLYGGDGVDALYGEDGRDRLEGGDMADALHGGEGNDTLHGEDHNDSLAGGAGHNDLFGGDGADTMSAGSGNDRFEGGEGVDFVDYRAIGTGVAINLDQAIQNPLGAGFDELIGIEGLLGTAFHDILWGVSTGANRLHGMDGNDELRGGSGAARARIRSMAARATTRSTARAAWIPPPTRRRRRASR